MWERRGELPPGRLAPAQLTGGRFHNRDAPSKPEYYLGSTLPKWLTHSAEPMFNPRPSRDFTSALPQLDTVQVVHQGKAHPPPEAGARSDPLDSLFASHRSGCREDSRRDVTHTGGVCRRTRMNRALFIRTGRIQAITSSMMRVQMSCRSHRSSGGDAASVAPHARSVSTRIVTLFMTTSPL